MSLEGLRAVVVTCSDRATAGVYADRSGPLAVEALRRAGFECAEPIVVPDGPAVGDAIRTAVADGARLVLTTGGTGLAPRDATPEQTRACLDAEVPGIAEAIRARGVAKGVGTAVLSRGIAGRSGQALIVNLPGSTGGVRDAMEVLLPDLVDHALSQIIGGDH